MNEIFAEKVVTERRTYFFDVKETREGSLYLVIGELTQVAGDTERHRVMVFEESLDAFLLGLSKAVAYIKNTEQPSATPAARDTPAAPESSVAETLQRIEAGINDLRKHFT